MSRHGEVADCGCSPGFWWRSPHGLVKWSNTEIIPALYGPDQMFNTVFGRNFFIVDRALELLGPGPPSFDISDTNLQGLCGSTGNPGGNLHAVVFHAIAALLNASFYGDRYPAPYKMPGAVIGAFQSAYDASNPCEQLDAFMVAVDVYNGLWCFNGFSNENGDWIE